MAKDKVEPKEEIKAIAPKMRIQLLGPNQEVLSDRLVDQRIELTTGPKYTHEGPVRLEVTLSNKGDDELIGSYIKTIAQDKPELEKGTRGRKPLESGEENLSPREDIMEEVYGMSTGAHTQDDIIKYLRKLGYVFLLTEDFLYHFPEFPFEKKHIGEPTDKGQYPDSYQWMVRCLKRGKDPKVDKYDPQLIFGFRLRPERKERFAAYLFKEYVDKVKFKAPIPSKNAFTFQSFDMIKFPHYMTPEEREKWGKEHRIYEADPDKPKSKFYLRWLPEVVLPKKKKKDE